MRKQILEHGAGSYYFEYTDHPRTYWWLDMINETDILLSICFDKDGNAYGNWRYGRIDLEEYYKFEPDDMSDAVFSELNWEESFIMKEFVDYVKQKEDRKE